MKIYAKQIAPEHQESPYYIFGNEDESYSDITITGNSNYRGRKSEMYERVVDNLDELASVVNDFMNGAESWQGWESITEVLQNLVPPAHKEKYCTKDVNRWKKLLKFDFDAWMKSGFRSSGKPYYETEDGICEALELTTGKKYDWTTIRGCCQGCWQYVFYPVDEYSKNSIKCLETEYFNTGSEWIIHDEEISEDDLDDSGLLPAHLIEGYSIYCYEWGGDGIRKEIASHVGGKSEDVVLYEHDGYTKSSKYRLVA